MTISPGLTFAVALAAGVLMQGLAHHLRVPGIVLLLLAGVLLGPDVAGIVQPGLLGHGLEILVGFSVAVILFEGGLNLNISRLRREAISIRRLITLGAAITAIGGTLTAHFLLGWGWQISLLFGTLVIVTGPTVITPLLRRIRVRQAPETILEAEGVLIDPVGAIVAVVALEVVLATTTTGAAYGLLGIPLRLLVGAAVGLVGGFVIGVLLRHEEIVPEGLENVFTLGTVLALFAASNAILAESGIMASVAAGLVVGNMRTRLQKELKEFKEQLTVMLVGLLFVLLAADVRLGEVVNLGWAGVAVVLVLMVVVRPIAVWASTYGSGLSTQERLFISWLGPRGIVAAAVASLFAERLAHHGMPEAGTELRALVFLTIAVTVVVQGLSGGWIAGALGVRRPRDQGYVIVGANALGRTLAHALEAAGEETVLIDSNAVEVSAAEEQGLNVIFGNANDEGPLLRANVESRRGFVSVTTNEGVNLLLARRTRERFKPSLSLVTLHSAKAGVREEQVHEMGGAILFGRPIDIAQWGHRLHQEHAVVERWRSGPDAVALSADDGEGWHPAVLPLAVRRGEQALPFHDQLRPQRGDVLTIATLRSEIKPLRERMHAAGWERVSEEVGVGAG